MKTVFVLVQKENGPSGQGGESAEYYSLLHDGKCFDLGKPSPAFSSKEAANEYLKENVDPHWTENYFILELEHK